jgi:type I restriction enzyme S subunit
MSEVGEKKGLVPKLRFPEFSDEWDASILDRIADVNPTPVSGLPDQFRYIDLESVEDGTLLQSRIERRATAPSRAQRIVQFNDVLFQTVRPYQKNNLLFSVNDGNAYVASTGYAQVRAHGSAAFLYHLLETDGFQRDVQRRCTGSNYPAIASSDLANITVPWPSNPEQREIAECLQSLDELIAAETEKLEGLKRHKKGLLQQLFPAEGETVPRLRFSKFRQSGGWVEHELAELVHFSSGGTPSKDNPKFWGGKIPWISAEAMHVVRVSDSYVRVTDHALESGLAIAPKGSLLILTRGSMLFRRVPLCITERDVAFNQDVKCMRPKDVNAEFLLYSLLSKEARIPIEQTGIGAGKIETDTLKSLQIELPSPEEQESIAVTFGNIDQANDMSDRFVDLLRTHKAALMQQLFPTLDETEQ